MMGRGFGYGFGGYGCGGGLFMIILLLLVIGIVVWIARRPKGHDDDHGHRSLEILNERLARGEITTEEYEKLKKVITH